MKHIFTLIVVGFPLIACVDKASADVYWNNNNGAAPGGDRSWGNAANWSGGGIGTLPSASGAGNAIVKPWPDLTQMPIVNTLGNTATQVYLTEGSSLSVVTGGSLLVNSYVTGQWNNCGVTDVSGGLLQAASLLLGNGGFDGKINISGGSVLANYLSINVSGGARMNISGNGSFVAPTSNLGNIKYWIEHHAIQAYGGSGAVRIDTTSQAGKIVLTALVSGYSSWAANNAPSGNAADDYDNDGVSNGVECVLGGALNTNDSAKLPQLSIMGGNVIFTFVRDQASIPGTTLEIQVGTDLANWPTIYTVGADTAGSSNGVTVLKDTPATGKDTITLSRPQSDLPTKLFARLCVRTN